MIAFLRGEVVAKSATEALLDVGGVGYCLGMSTHALAGLPSNGCTVTVFTYMHVKDDGIALYGFGSEAERELFVRLIGVSGVGPKIALAALSAFKAPDLMSIIAAGDVARISTISGIGKKTAQRLVLELQGVLQEMPAAAGAAGTGASMKEATDALASLGFTYDEITAALKGFDGDSSDVSAVVRFALRNRGGVA